MWVSTQNCCPWATFCISFEMFDNLVRCAGYFCTLAIALLGYSNNSNKCWLWRWSWTFTEIWNQMHCSIHSVPVFLTTLSCMLQRTYMLQRFQGKMLLSYEVPVLQCYCSTMKYNLVQCVFWLALHWYTYKNTNTQKSKYINTKSATIMQCSVFAGWPCTGREINDGSRRPQDTCQVSRGGCSALCIAYILYFCISLFLYLYSI